MTILRSTIAAVRINFSSIRSRWPMALASVTGIALVVAVLLGFLAMAEGFTRALTSAGSPKVAIIVGKGVRSEPLGVLTPETVHIIEAHLGTLGIDPANISQEYVHVASIDLADGGAGSVIVRGVGPAAAGLRAHRRNSSGGAAAIPAQDEVVLGSAVALQLGGREVGDTVRIAGHGWRVAGLVEADGSALESEAWIDSGSLEALIADKPGVQSLRFALKDEGMLRVIEKIVATDPRLSLQVVREDRFYAAQSAGLATMLRRFAWPLAIAMAIGALAGSLNTMFSSVASRAKEIATLRAIGFGPVGMFWATFAEALLLAVTGALLGVVLTFLLIAGRSGATLAGGAAQVGFTYALTPAAVATALSFAILVGLLGGALPALKAARQPILAGLNTDAP